MSSLQLVPYERGEKVTEWTVILRDSANGKTVLYDPQKQQINLQSVNPDCCPFCRQKLPSNQQQSNNTAPFSHGIDPNSFIDSNYFRYLAAYCQTDPSLQDKPQFGDHLSTGALLQGYYQRFFREIKQLGRGYRGSVFLCQHTLDGVPLGEYAIKKIAVGDSRQWLIRMLREVHTLEQISHYNIIDYKHCWLEDHQFSSFGPPVPCLFILMELANGGNLEEYVLSKQADGGSGLLSLDEIYSFFQDICSGLDHLHRHGIIHKDLKPPNLLLKYTTAYEIPRILLSDFGECENLFDHSELSKRSGATGTLEFTAPELLKVDQKGNFFVEYSPAADLWSLGMILYYLCFGKLPYSQIDQVDSLRLEILEFKCSVLPQRDIISADIRSLILRLLSRNPNDRPSAGSILKMLSEKKPYNSHDVTRKPLSLPPPEIAARSSHKLWLYLKNASSVILLLLKFSLAYFVCFPRTLQPVWFSFMLLSFAIDFALMSKSISVKLAYSVGWIAMFVAVIGGGHQYSVCL